MVKILILNQATLHPKYQEIEKLMYETWGSINHPNVKIIHYYGMYEFDNNLTTKFSTLPKDGECLLYDSDKLIIGTYDCSYPINHSRQSIIADTRNEKFILALEYCINNFDFDYILRICNTSYIDISKMYNYISKLPKEKIYCGARNCYNYDTYFVAGHNVFMSRDVVNVLVNHKKEYLESKYPEDLAVGHLLMHKLGYTSFDYQDSMFQYNTTHCDVVNRDPSTMTLHDLDSIFSYRIQNNIGMFNVIHNLVLDRDIAINV